MRDRAALGYKDECDAGTPFMPLAAANAAYGGAP